MSSSWNSWAGRMIKKFEDACLEVDEFITKDGYNYVQTQIQSASANVRHVCSEIMDDVLDKSLVESTNEEDTDSSLIQNTESPHCKNSKGAVDPSFVQNAESPPRENSTMKVVDADSCLVQNTEAPPSKYSTMEEDVDLSSVNNTEYPPSENSTVKGDAHPLVQNTECQPCENSTMKVLVVDTSSVHNLKAQPTENPATNNSSEYAKLRPEEVHSLPNHSTMKPVEEEALKSCLKNTEMHVATVENPIEEKQRLSQVPKIDSASIHAISPEKLNNKSIDFIRDEEKEEANDKALVKVQIENLQLFEDYGIYAYSSGDESEPRYMEKLDPATKAMVEQQREDIRQLKEFLEADYNASLKQIEDTQLLKKALADCNENNSSLYKSQVKSIDFTRDEEKEEANDKALVKVQIENLQLFEDYGIYAYSGGDESELRDMEKLDPATKAMVEQQIEDIRQFKEFLEAVYNAPLKPIEDTPNDNALVKVQIENPQLLEVSGIYAYSGGDESEPRDMEKLDPATKAMVEQQREDIRQFKEFFEADYNAPLKQIEDTQLLKEALADCNENNSGGDESEPRDMEKLDPATKAMVEQQREDIRQLKEFFEADYNAPLKQIEDTQLLKEALADCNKNNSSLYTSLVKSTQDEEKEEANDNALVKVQIENPQLLEVCGIYAYSGGDESEPRDMEKLDPATKAMVEQQREDIRQFKEFLEADYNAPLKPIEDTQLLKEALADCNENNSNLYRSRNLESRDDDFSDSEWEFV